MLAAVAMAFIASIERLVWPQLLSCVLLGMVAASWLAVARRPRFEVRVEMPERIVVAEPFEAVVHLVNHSARGRQAVLVRHRLRAARPIVPDGTAFVENSGKEVAVRMTRTPIARGAAACSEVEVVVVGPFGFFSSRSLHRAGGPVLALPSTAAPFALSALGASVHTGTAVTPGAEPRGIREWRVGDASHDVHWRSTLRAGRPLVVEREAPAESSLVVVVMAASEGRGRGADQPFERAISAVAAAAVTAARRGTPICLVAQRSTDCVTHAKDPRAVLDALARIVRTEAPSDVVLRHAAEHAGPGGTILLAANRATPAAWKSRLAAVAAASGAATMNAGDALAVSP